MRKIYFAPVSETVAMVRQNIMAASPRQKVWTVIDEEKSLMRDYKDDDGLIKYLTEDEIKGSFKDDDDWG